MKSLSTCTRRLAMIALVVSTSPAPAGADQATDHPAGGAQRKEPEPAAPTAPSEPGDAGTSGYFRFDYDSYGLQLWVGATHQIGGIQIASDVYVTDSYGEVDLGPQFTLGDVTLIATIGSVYDFSAQSVVAVVAPLLTTVYDHRRLYVESWLQLTFGSPFADGGEDVFHTRNFILYKLNESIWIGPQLELNYEFAQAERIVSLPVGGQVSLGYGKDNRLSLFLGFETRQLMDATTGQPMDSDRLAGRLTFIHLW